MKQPISIMCYGDSNTYGYNPENGMRYPSKVRWTGILQKKLGSKYQIIEEGCNGRTAFAVPEDEPWKFGGHGLEVCLNTHKPIDIFVVMLGSNDLKTHFDASPDDIASGVKSIIERAKEFLTIKQGYAPKTVVFSPAVLGDGFGPDDEFDQASKEKSEGFAVAFAKIAVETGSFFMNAAQYIESSKIDSLHLDPKAHAKLAEASENFIKSV